MITRDEIKDVIHDATLGFIGVAFVGALIGAALAFIAAVAAFLVTA